MNLIIKDDSFNVDNISIKKRKNNLRYKLIYKLGLIYIIGIPLEINGYIIVNQSKNFLYIDIEKSLNKNILLSVDNYFREKNTNYYSFINDSIIKIKKNNPIMINNNDPLFISINNIRDQGKKPKIQIYTI